MKKIQKAMRRLSLTSETLRHLSSEWLIQAVGGLPIRSLEGNCPTVASCGCPTLTSAACDTAGQCPTVATCTR